MSCFPLSLPSRRDSTYVFSGTTLFFLSIHRNPAKDEMKSSFARFPQLLSIKERTYSLRAACRISEIKKTDMKGRG